MGNRSADRHLVLPRPRSADDPEAPCPRVPHAARTVAAAPQARRRPWRLIAAAPIGFALIAVAEMPRVKTLVMLGGISAERLVSSVGEALLVAWVIALLVDRRVKMDLAAEISHQTSSAFFRDFLGGRYLPEAYYRGMRELAATDVLSMNISWQLELAFAERDPAGRRYLVITSTVHNTFTNTSNGSIKHGMTWLMYIRDGRPPSRLTRFELTVTSESTRPDGVGDVAQFIARPEDLASVNELLAEGRPTAEHDARTPEIPPGAKVVHCATGITYHYGSGLMPLVCRYPTLIRRLTISGPALAELDIEVRHDAGTLTPAPADRAGGALEFCTNSLAIKGSTIRVQWAPKVVDPPPTDRPDQH